MSSDVTTRDAARTPAKSRTRVRQDPVTVLIVAAVAFVLFLLVLLPLGTILARAFSPDGTHVLTGIMSTTTNRTIIINTIVLGCVVGLIGTLAGFFLAYVQARVDIPPPSPSQRRRSPSSGAMGSSPRSCSDSSGTSTGCRA